MADRGFTIRPLLADRGATLNIPPFTCKCSNGKWKRLNASKIIQTRKIVLAWRATVFRPMGHVTFESPLGPAPRPFRDSTRENMASTQLR